MASDSIFETQDGSHSVFSEKHGVSYHSKYGAIQESMHVFIQSGLRYRSIGKDSLNILEIGFGTGLNALLTLKEAIEKNVNIYYEAVEAYPISLDQARDLNYPSLLSDTGSYFIQMHELEWGKSHNIHPNFTFLKQNHLFQDIDHKDKFDVIYFDAFAPNAQPELWEVALLSKMYNALKDKGVLVTYCAKGAVKRALKSLGFTLEAIKGPPGKREMTRAVKSLIG